MDGDAQANVAAKPGEYVVVARRYRPQAFGDLIGQGMVAQALKNAITTDRVGHAYLFTGARGVGKTSAARILAKALNCSRGPTTDPCGECDICIQVANGDDVDVLEIDGASNRGIDEIRQLRSNVGIRPSRSRFKVYIIDEVHMLTKEAFNALLKTLEEPPEHVKFIFCTTEPGKIPITVLSRCQRFDFSPVDTEDIARRLSFIVKNEGATADDEALELLARRAAGSMRDSQSLLEQLLSFVGNSITVDDVHSMFGTAKADRVTALLRRLIDRDAGGVLTELQTTLHQGVDAGQLAEQLLTCLRDVMASTVGCDPNLLLFHSPSDAEQLRKCGQEWGIETLLAALQILDQAVSRMRQSMHGRILLEVALVRIANLEDLDLLSQIAAQVSAGQPLSVDRPAKKKLKTRGVTAAEAPPAGNRELDEANSSPKPSPSTLSSESAGTAPDSDEAKRTAVGDANQEPTDLSAHVDAEKESIDPPPTVTARAERDEPPIVDAAVAEGTPSEPDHLSGDEPGPSEPIPAASTLAEPAEESSSSIPAPAEAPPTVSSAGDSLESSDVSVPRIELTQSSALNVWQAALGLLGDMTADFAAQASDIAISAPNRLVVKFIGRYNTSKAYCERPEKRAALEQAVEKITGKPVRIDFSVTREDGSHETPPAPAVSTQQLKRQIAAHPLVEMTVKLFDAQVLKVEPPRK